MKFSTGIIFRALQTHYLDVAWEVLPLVNHLLILITSPVSELL